MKKQSLILLMLIPFLAGCSKTNELYADYAYNSSDFMENYYTEQNGVRDLEIASQKENTLIAGLGYTSTNSLNGIREEDNPEGYPWSSPLDLNEEFGRNNNLTKIDESFAYGYLSKLYDGRVRCEGKFQLSRVQLDKYGYATYFPKKLVNYKYFAFSLRGATDYENSSTDPSPLRGTVYIDANISFYRHIVNSTQYDVVTFKLLNIPIPCDNGGDTNLVTIYLADDMVIDGVLNRNYYYDISDAVAMSFDYELKTTRDDLSDDSQVEKNHHFAVMLYEVLLPKSSWR